MRAVNRYKIAFGLNKAKLMSKFYNATTTIAAHAAFVPIAIKIDHFKIVGLFFIQQYQTVSPYAKFSVAKPLNQLRYGFC